MPLDTPSPATIAKVLLAAALAAACFSSIPIPQTSARPLRVGDVVQLRWDRFGSPFTVTRVYHDGDTFDITRGDDIFLVSAGDVRPCD